MGGYTIQGTPSDVLTSERIGTRRLAVDSQQTSFEENAQFTFNDRLQAVPSTEQIVYRFTFGNAINIFSRSMNLWLGGREVLGYDDSQVTFTGLLSDISNQVFPANTNLADSGLSVHPTSALTVERATGAGILTATGSPFYTSAVLTDGNANHNATGGADNQNRLGIASGSVIWLVFNHIGGNVATTGHYKFNYEERL